MERKKGEKIEFKKVLIVIIGLAITLVSITLLLVFLLLQGDSTADTPLRVNVNDVTMQVGDIQYDYYDVNNEEANITILVDKEGIIEIDENKIVAVKSGIVNITLIATYQNSISKEEFTVEILNYNYSYEIVPILNCSYVNEKLLMSDSVCQFLVNVYDKSGNIISDNFNFSSTNNSIMQKQLSNFVLFTTEDCSFTISLTEANFSFSIEVVYEI